MRAQPIKDLAALRAMLVLVVALLLLGSNTMVATVAGAHVQQEPPIAISSSWPPGIQRFIRAEESDPMLSILYRWGLVQAGRGGCYSPNCGTSSQSWQVEWQRMGFRDVIGGVFHNDASEVETGLKIFGFAFHREASNGSFPGSTGPFHGTAMFLAEAAPALIVLKYSAMSNEFAKRVTSQSHAIRRAARYVYFHGRHIEKIDGGSTDRFFEAALAFEASGLLSQDKKLQRWSKQYARGGIRRGRPNGRLPEWGGHDVYYQALGMVDACRYLLMMHRGPVHSSLYNVLVKGERWEAGRVGPDGTVNDAGDTRSKHPFPYSVVSSFARWSAIAQSRDTPGLQSWFGRSITVGNSSCFYPVTQKLLTNKLRPSGGRARDCESLHSDSGRMPTCRNQPRSSVTAQCSAIFPSSRREMCTCSTAKDLPVAPNVPKGRRTSPSLVPLQTTHAQTLSSAAMMSSIVNRWSEEKLRTAS